MKKMGIRTTVLALLLGIGWSQAAVADEGAAARPKIQVAIVLDTSSSMAGLINQARTHLWSVVNQFIGATVSGQDPVFEVALLEYGAGRLPAEDDYTRLVVPLTGNLDKVSEELFKLTAVGRPGGSLENCGQIIDRAVKELEWDQRAEGMKCLFIAGNETFTQGKVDFRDACRASVERGITVSTIYCGNHGEGIRLHWEEAAKLADGTYLSIDHNRVAVSDPTPHDKELATLNAQLNQTYLPYGNRTARALAVTRQVEQDAAAARLNANTVAQRARFKGSTLYRNDEWDLVDGVKNGKVKLDELEEEQLPESFRKLPAGERAAHLEKMSKTRSDLQAKIADLTERRDAFVQQRREQRVATAAPTRGAVAGEALAAEGLDKAIIAAIKRQAEKKNVKLEEK